MKTHERKFIEAADANPQAFENFVRAKLGVSGRDGAKLLDLHDKLGRGGGFSREDIATLQHAYRDLYAPDDVARYARELEASTAPGERRARIYLSMLAGDPAVAEDRLHDASPGYKELAKLAAGYHLNTLVAQLDSGADNAKPRDLHKVEVTRPAEDPLSARSLIERHYEEPGVREFAQAVEDGNEYAEMLARDRLADQAQAAVNTLRPDAENVSTRESVAAAFDLHAVEDVGIDQGWLPEKE